MKINRFPKMALLWYAVLKHHYKLDENLARAAGYAAATYFAALKNNHKAIAQKPKKKSNFSKAPRKKMKYIEFPFGLKLPYEGNSVYFDGKKINAAKFDHYMHSKFGDSPVFYTYKKYAEYLAMNHELSFWKSKWYKLWKEIRDKDWAKQLELFEI